MHPQPGKPRPPTIEHSLLLDEMRAARAFGMGAYLNAPRELQALMVGTQMADSAISSFRQWDMTDHDK